MSRKTIFGAIDAIKLNENFQELYDNDADFKIRIDNIIAYVGQSNAEIVDARMSNVKGTTFLVLKSRLEDIEQDIKTQQDIEQDTMLQQDIKGTKQFVTIDLNGNVTKIQHKDINSVVIREDIFTYDVNLIIEISTLLLTGRTLTCKYYTDTLETEII